MRHALWLFIWVFAAQAEVLFIDLNDADLEVQACAQTAGSNSVRRISPESFQGKPVTPARIEAAIAYYESQGIKLDSVIISGHDGTGEYFGGKDERNYFSSSDLRSILNKHPRTRESLRVAMLWGCYGGSVDANESYWLSDMGNINSTIAFPIQSPDKTRPNNHAALAWACDPKNREALARSGSLDEICRMFKNYPVLAQAGAALCGKEGIASQLYNDAQNRKTCYSNQELKDRCRQLDPTREVLDRYQCFFNASPGCEDPPLDGGDVNAPAGKNPIRKMYDEANLYGHCAEELKGQNYLLPSPSVAIRLTKFKQIKENINRLNHDELGEFDRRLTDLGLGGFALGDLSGLTRGQLKSRIDEVKRRLQNMERQHVVGANGTKASAVYTMALGIDATLIQLSYRAKDSNSGVCGVKDAPAKCFRVCSHFSLVHAGIQDPGRKSECVMSYEEAESL